MYIHLMFIQQYIDSTIACLLAKSVNHIFIWIYRKAIFTELDDKSEKFVTGCSTFG